MTTDRQAALSIMVHRIEAYLTEVAKGRHSLSHVRDEFRPQFRHPNMTIWGPELHGDHLRVVIIEVEEDSQSKETQVSVHAPDWCNWERGIKKPLAS